MPGPFTIAHLSDVHLSPAAPVPARALLGKRALGYVSWRLRRRAAHRREILDALVGDLAAVAPDHLVVTGDLTTLGLPEEFASARRWLDALGSPETITVVPGNHDAYVAEPWDRTLALWAPYMCSDDAPAGPEETFPSVRRRGPVAVVGLCSALPTPPFLAVGRLGSAQLGLLGRRLDEAGRDGRFRVLLLHHPIAPGAVRWRRRLTDAGALRDALAATGVDLVLHGHAHRAMVGHVATPGGPAPVVGAGSATLLPRAGRAGAQYNVYRLRPGEDGWEVSLSVRVYAPETGRFVPRGEPRALRAPAAATRG